MQAEICNFVKTNEVMQYYIFINGAPVGPMTVQQLFAYNINQNTNVSTDGVNWRPLFTYPDLMLAMRQNGIRYEDSDISNKKLLCGILAIVLGCLGIQYFLVGKTWGGILTILLSLITCGAWPVITLIQGILMLCMTDEEFKRKYIDSTSVLPLF